MNALAFLRWWMRLVGCFYVALLVPLLPPVFTRAVPHLYPALQAGPGSPEVAALADAWLLVGLALATLGALLLHASRAPQRHLDLVRVVIAWEAVVGLLAGLYFLLRGLMAPAVALAALAPPPVIALSGWLALRAAGSSGPAADAGGGG
jgi:BphX-like